MSGETTESQSSRTPAPLPPPRPGVRHVRLPLAGIVVADDELRRSVNRRFHWPMIVLALLILPLLVLDFVYFHRAGSRADFVPQDGWVFWTTRIGFAVIWLAFLIEFVVKISIAESRFEYVKRNWLDVIIILVPVLRPLRVAYMAKTSRVFTLRGVCMKLARYFLTLLIGLEATDRILQRLGLKPRAGRRPAREMTRHQLIDEVKRLRRLTDAWEDWYRAHQAYLERHGGGAGPDPAPPPVEDPVDEGAVACRLEPERRWQKLKAES